MQIEYTCGFMFSDRQVVLVEKIKPAWQKGKLNGIGGKVEPGEVPIKCMVREWKEETSHEHEDWEYVFTMKDETAIVHFFKAVVDRLPVFPKLNDAGEEIVVTTRYDLPEGCVPNLYWIVPMMNENTFRITNCLEKT